MSSVKLSRKQQIKEEQTSFASEGSHTSSDACDTRTKSSKDKKCKTSWWPIILFVIIFIIIAIAVCACGGHNSVREIGSGGLLGGALLFFILWIIILWFFCSSGNNTAAWFFVILIFAILIAGAIAGAIGDGWSDC